MEAGIELKKISHELCEINKNYLKILEVGNEILKSIADWIKHFAVGELLKMELKENCLHFSFLNSKYMIAIIQPNYTIRNEDLLLQKARLVTYLMNEEKEGQNIEIKELNFLFTVTSNIYKDKEGADYPEFSDFLRDYFKIFRDYILSDKSIKTTLTNAR